MRRMCANPGCDAARIDLGSIREASHPGFAHKRRMNPPPGPQTQALWLSSMRRYFALIAVGNLLWEVAQCPLYGPWHLACWWQATHAGRRRVPARDARLRAGWTV